MTLSETIGGSPLEYNWRIQVTHSPQGEEFVGRKAVELTEGGIPGLAGVGISETWRGEGEDPGFALTIAFNTQADLLTFRGSEFRNRMVAEGAEHGFERGDVLAPVKRVAMPTS